jgi:hypothetical protein
MKNSLYWFNWMVFAESGFELLDDATDEEYQNFGLQLCH